MTKISMTKKRKVLLLLIIPLQLLAAAALQAEEEVFIQSISIAGNRATSARYIKSLLALEERRSYGLDEAIDLINVSRSRLEKTGLFRNIFFDDQLLEGEEHLLLHLTVRVREKGYLHFGPSGYFGVYRGSWYADLSLYAEYTNLYGNGSLLYLEVPYYRDAGVLLLTENRIGVSTLTLGYEYRDDRSLDITSHRMLTGLSLGVSPTVRVGIGSHLYRGELTSVVLFPHVELGSRERPERGKKTWLYIRGAPFYGFNIDQEDFYGIESGLALYRDLFLKIVYTLQMEASVAGGELPEQYRFSSNVRGTRPDRYRGDLLLSASSELRVPWPTNPRFHLVPFVDAALIGEDPELLLGGGLGLHWYTRFQDPLVAEVAVGKGIMVNFSREF